MKDEKILEGEGKGANGVQSMKGKGEKSSGKNGKGVKEDIFSFEILARSVYIVSPL